MATKKKKVDSFCIEEPVINKIPVTNCIVDNSDAVRDTIMKIEDNQNKDNQNKAKIQETVNFLASFIVFICTAVCGISALFYFPIVLGVLVFCQSIFNIYLLFNFTDFGKKIEEIVDKCIR